MTGFWKHLDDHDDEIAQGIPDKPWYAVRHEDGELFVEGHDTQEAAIDSADSWDKYYIHDLYDDDMHAWADDNGAPFCICVSQKDLIENYRDEIDFYCNR